MNEQRARELFLDYHRGSLSAEDTAAVRALLAAQPALRNEFAEFARTLDLLDAMPNPKPSPRLRAGVLAAIEAEKRAMRNLPASAAQPAAPVRRHAWFWFAQAIGAAALLAVGFEVGSRRGEAAAESSRIAADATQGQINRLQEKLTSLEDQMRQNSLVVQEAQRPTGDRLRAVLASASLDKPSDTVIDELVGTLALDPSTNVRLTALQTLYAHRQLESVRSSVISFLPREPNPLVQVAMIDFLVASGDRNAMTTLATLAGNENANGSVRAAAKRALAEF